MPDPIVPDRPRTVLFCAVLIAAPLLEVIEAALSPLADGTTAQDMASIAAAPGRFALSASIGALATFLLLPALLGLAHRASARSPKLALAASVAIGATVLGFVAVRATQGAELVLATSEPSVRVAASRFDAITSTPMLAGMLALFLIGNVVGLVLLVIALWRSRRAPIGALVLLILFPILDFGLPGGMGTLIAHLVLTAATTWIAIGLLRAAPVRREHAPAALGDRVDA
jgi:hypothetical protein